MKLKTISVHKTTIPQLNWLVAVCIGLKPNLFIFKTTGYLASEHNYATNWAQGGPIIEQEKISLETKHDGWWLGSYQYNYSDEKEYLMLGETPLIAAMRSYVASKLGRTAEVPEEL